MQFETGWHKTYLIIQAFHTYNQSFLSKKPSSFLPWELTMEDRRCSSAHRYRHCHEELSLKPGTRHSLENTAIQRWTHPLDLPRWSPPNNTSNSISQAVTFTPHKPRTHAPQLLHTDWHFSCISFSPSTFYIEVILAQHSRKDFCFPLKFMLLHLQRLQRISEVKRVSTGMSCRAKAGSWLLIEVWGVGRILLCSLTSTFLFI